MYVLFSGQIAGLCMADVWKVFSCLEAPRGAELSWKRSTELSFFLDHMGVCHFSLRGNGQLAQSAMGY
jgi:hypothetical protein